VKCRCRAAGGFWLDVEILDVEGVIFDELATAFDVLAHERGEDLFGGSNVFQLDLDERAASWIHGCFPELRGSHFAEALVTLDRIFFTSLLDDVLEDFARGLLLDGILRDLGGTLNGLGGSLDGSSTGVHGAFELGLFRVLEFLLGLLFDGLGGGARGLAGVLDEEGSDELLTDLGVLGEELAGFGGGG
jgi:hypothetical protein